MGIKQAGSTQEKKLLVKREKRFGQNKSFLLDPEGFERPFPASIDSLPNNIKEVFLYLQNTVDSGDLVAL